MQESRFYHIRKLQRLYNERNKNRLFNKSVSLICSNCTGGIMYHWLGLQFRSPFINLYMDANDYLTALEDFDNFLEAPIKPLTDSGKTYPVGRSTHKGELIHFMHYGSFDEAIKKWDDRKSRIDKNNMAVMFTNWPGENGGEAVRKRLNEPHCII